MTKMKKSIYQYLLLAILLYGFLPQSWGQDLKRDLVAINSAIEKQKNFSVEMTYKVWQENRNGAPILEEEGRATKVGEMLVTQRTDNKVIYFSGETLTLDFQNKLIILSDAAPKSSTAILIPEIDQMLGEYLQRAESYCSSEGQAGYRLDISGEDFDRIEIEFNEHTHLPSKVVFIYGTRKGQETFDYAMEVQLDWKEMTGKSKKERLDKYLVQPKGKWEPSETYKEYVFHNLKTK